MFEFDPERAIWKPGRRSFLFMFGAALVAPNVGDLSHGVLVRVSSDYGKTWNTHIEGKAIQTGDWVSVTGGPYWKSSKFVFIYEGIKFLEDKGLGYNG